jgi:hypothetical protein
MHLELARAGLSIIGRMMLAKDHFMWMFIDSMPDIHILLTTTCTKAVEMAENIKGSIDSRGEKNKEELRVIEILYHIVKEAL